MRYYVGNFFYGDDFWHYGVKGQKKGVRRYQNPDGSLKPEGYKHYGRNPHPRSFGTKLKKVASNVGKGIGNAAKSAARNHRSVKKMSDEEIKKRIDRYKLENEYLKAKKDQKDLRARKKKEMSEGKKFILSMLKDVAVNTITTVIKTKSNEAIKDRDRAASDMQKDKDREESSRQKEKDRRHALEIEGMRLEETRNTDRQEIERERQVLANERRVLGRQARGRRSGR